MEVLSLPDVSVSVSEYAHQTRQYSKFGILHINFIYKLDRENIKL